MRGASYTFRFEIGPSGAISAPVAMKTAEGADVKLKLNNRTAHAYALRLTGPGGERRAAVDVPAHHLGQTNYVFSRTGTYLVGIYPGGSTSAQRRFPIAVRAD